MILVDTSVWVGHFRVSSPALVEKLDDCAVLTHPFVIGELACGHLSQRKRILSSLADLPVAPLASHGEVMDMVERRQFAGRGIGWVDMHLLAAALLTPGARLWTHDRRLENVAADVGVAYS